MKSPFVSVSFPGFVGVITGVSMSGIGIYCHLYIIIIIIITITIITITISHKMSLLFYYDYHCLNVTFVTTIITNNNNIIIAVIITIIILLIINAIQGISEKVWMTYNTPDLLPGSYDGQSGL